MNDPGPDAIRQSWEDNAAAWTAAVRGGRIESRRRVTDGAVLDAVTALAPARVLDVGCGEGWLCRALEKRGVAAVGVDGSAPLVEAARRAGPGDYHDVLYPSLATRGDLGLFDVAVCNFSLLEADLGPVLEGVRARLEPGGALVIQTLPPDAGEEGWRREDFTALGPGFGTPMPWYQRSRGSWVRTLEGRGWRLERLEEPCHPDTGSPVSLLMTWVAGT